MKKKNTWIADNRKVVNQPLYKLFEDLDKIKGDCIYWFEAKSKKTASLMVDDLEKFRVKNKSNRNNYRSISAKGKYYDSNILYVGTVKSRVRKRDGLTTIASRTFQHLGLYDKGSTGGLHLWYWANNDVILNVIELSEELSIYRNVLEKLLAIELEPLIGVHR